MEIDTLEYSRVKATAVSMRLRIYLFALTNTNIVDNLHLESKVILEEGPTSCQSSFHYSTSIQTHHPSIIHTEHLGRQGTARVLCPYYCQRARWAYYQHGRCKLQTKDWPNHDGVGKSILWIA